MDSICPQIKIMKHNLVTLLGPALQVPKIIKDEDGSYKKGMFPLAVVKNDRNSGDLSKNLRQDVPVIMSKDSEIIKKIEEIQPNDLVYLKGVIVTKNVKKVSICPHCGAEKNISGMIVYICPIFLRIVKSGLTKEEASNLLFENREISNDVLVIGHLCNDPIKYTTMNKKTIAEYQIAIDRTFRLEDDSQCDNETYNEIDENKAIADFPWIKSYGKNAEEDLKRLKRGSSILVEGYIQARNTPRTEICDNCSSCYSWQDMAMEIVPYETEYLANYVTDEELEKKKLAN